MIPVLGLPLHEAEQRLKEAGYAVTAREVSAKKKLEGGNDLRVIAVKPGEGKMVYLEYAAFRTDLLNQ